MCVSTAIEAQVEQIQKCLKERKEPTNQPSQIFNRLMDAYKALNEIELRSLSFTYDIAPFEEGIQNVGCKVRKLCEEHFFGKTEKEAGLQAEITEFEAKVNELKSNVVVKNILEKEFKKHSKFFRNEGYKKDFKDYYEKMLQNVQLLDLEYRINPELMQFIRDNCPNIQGLNLSRIDDQILSSLPKNLHYLSVKHCTGMTKEGWKSLGELSDLRNLYLYNFSKEGLPQMDDESKLFVQALKRLTHLKTLYMRHLDVGRGNLHIDDSVFASLPKGLKSLEILANGVVQLGENWAGGLKNLPHLETLDFSFLNLSDLKKGLKANLRENSPIQTLTLSKVALDDEEVEIIAEALKTNRSLRKLDLSSNDISDNGAAALAKALKVNRTLIELTLDYNKIGFKGIVSIIEAVKDNNTLDKLYIHCKRINGEEKEILTKALENNKTLKC